MKILMPRDTNENVLGTHSQTTYASNSQYASTTRHIVSVHAENKAQIYAVAASNESKPKSNVKDTEFHNDSDNVGLKNKHNSTKSNKNGKKNKGGKTHKHSKIINIVNYSQLTQNYYQTCKQVINEECIMLLRHRVPKMQETFIEVYN